MLQWAFPLAEMNANVIGGNMIEIEFQQLDIFLNKRIL